jgi:hypothetical protein
MEQYLLDLPAPSLEVYQRLLQKNRDIIHGAFALDESAASSSSATLCKSTRLTWRA